jgi:hypothetical protein
MQLETGGGSGHGSGNEKKGKPLVFSTCLKTSHVVSTCKLRRQHRLTTALRPRWTGQALYFAVNQVNPRTTLPLAFFAPAFTEIKPTERHQSNITTELKKKAITAQKNPPSSRFSPPKPSHE